MDQLTAHKRQYTRNRGDLYLAFELGSKEWKLGFSVGFGQRPRERTVSAGDLAGVRREFRNRREVGALAGLVPTPHQSGDEAWERGISKAGNRYIRSMAIQIAWAWLRWQPQSKLSRWYEERFGNGSPRLRRIGIVALARKLLVDLWRYLEDGVVPEGAELKA